MVPLVIRVEIAPPALLVVPSSSMHRYSLLAHGDEVGDSLYFAFDVALYFTKCN